MNDKSINLFHISHPILPLSLLSLSFPVTRKKKRKLYCLISRCAVFSIVYASITLKHKINAYIKHDHEYNFFSSHVVNLWDFFFVPVDTSIAHTQSNFFIPFFCILHQVIHVGGELCIFLSLFHPRILFFCDLLFFNIDAKENSFFSFIFLSMKACGRRKIHSSSQDLWRK